MAELYLRLLQNKIKIFQQIVQSWCAALHRKFLNSDRLCLDASNARNAREVYVHSPGTRDGQRLLLVQNRVGGGFMCRRKRRSRRRRKGGGREGMRRMRGEKVWQRRMELEEE